MSNGRLRRSFGCRQVAGVGRDQKRSLPSPSMEIFKMKSNGWVNLVDRFHETNRITVEINPRTSSEEAALLRGRLEGWTRHRLVPSSETRRKAALLRTRPMDDVDMIRTMETLC